MRAVLIENPEAHKVTSGSRRVVERALEATFELEIVTTEAPGHAADLAREAVAAGAKTIVAYGGDGTVNEVVNGLGVGSDVVLAILPGGGTNVLARNLGYPNDLVEAAGHLIGLVERSSTRRITLGHLKAGAVDRLFTFGAGLVFDAETVRRVATGGLRPRLGDLAFVWAGLRGFVSARNNDLPALVVETPEGPVDAWWAILSNSDPFTYFGKRPLRVAPGASFERGLDLVAGRSMRFVRTLRWLRQTMAKGRHVRDDEILHLADLDHVTIRARRAVGLQADGEFLGEVHRLEATAYPQALTVWG